MQESYLLKIQKKDLFIVNYIDVEHFIEKLNRYTTIEAENMFKGLKPKPNNFLKELYLIIREMGGRFLFRQGYKDGVIGFYLAVLMGAYRVSSFLKLKIMEKYNSDKPREKILSDYENIVKKVIREYD